MLGVQARVRQRLPGLWRLPGGREAYLAGLKHYTTTDLTPEEIHAIGLAEVARLRAEGLQREGRVGNAEARLMAAADLVRLSGERPADHQRTQRTAPPKPQAAARALRVHTVTAWPSASAFRLRTTV